MFLLIFLQGDFGKRKLTAAERKRGEIMPREKPLFRSNLDRLDEKYPNKESLTYADLADFFGYSYRSAFRKWQDKYNKACNGVPKATIASVMSGE